MPTIRRAQGNLVQQAAKVTDCEANEVLGDTADGTSAARKDIQKAARDVGIDANIPPATSRKVRYQLAMAATAANLVAEAVAQGLLSLDNLCELSGPEIRTYLPAKKQ